MTLSIDHFPYLPYHVIGKHAADFLQQKRRFNQLPIDIEMIAESDLGLHIIPVQNLRSIIGMEAFLSSDLRDICVDRTAFEGRSYLHRFRFTLAHEVGHYVLHGHIYKRYDFKLSEDCASLLTCCRAQSRNFFRPNWAEPPIPTHWIGRPAGLPTS